jgi:Fic family protein
MARTVERGYTASHPWITYRLDLRPLETDAWLLLGEARSKSDHLALALLKPEMAERMNKLYLAKGAHATTAIEGNTLTEGEVLEIVEGRDDLPPSQQYLKDEVNNIVRACNQIKDGLMAGDAPEITPELLAQFNREVLEGLELEDHVVPGEIRTRPVVVGNYRGAPAEDCEYLVERLCDWLNSSDFEPKTPEWRVPIALLKAVLGHLYLAWIHPYGDGNGRTARLLELQILLAAGMPMPAAHLLSNHYNATRADYYRQLQHASASGGEIVPFLDYALRGFIDGIREQVWGVWLQQYQDRWEQFIYESFGDTHTQAKERQRRLVLELSKQTDPLPRRELVRMTPDLQIAYHDTERTLSRDLNALEGMGLIQRVQGGWQPMREQILAFRPVRRI